LYYFGKPLALCVAIFLLCAYNTTVAHPQTPKEGFPLAKEFDVQSSPGEPGGAEEKAINLEQGQEAPKPVLPSQRPGSELYEWLQMVLWCILLAILVFNCFARLTRVDGSSMDNTLEDGELMVVWSLGYSPKQGDIVVLNKTTAEFLGGEGGEAIVKRVIAVGGQTVDIDYATGTVYVDGEALSEPYIKETMYRPGSSLVQNTHWEVPDGSIFVMGDNRNNSTDSRHDLLGTIDEDYVLGKVVLALWPMDRIGLL
jgi:signal peptidase I